MFSKNTHHIIFLVATALLVIGMPVSYFLLSLSIILLSLNWILELVSIKKKEFRFRIKEKFKLIIQRKSLLLIFSVYLVHLIWFINTEDFAYALHDIRIKLPLLALPIIYGTAPPLKKGEFKVVLLLFIATVIVSSFISTYIRLGFSSLDPIDSRYASPFISHIRFSLLVVLSIFTLFYLAAFKAYPVSGKEVIIYIFAIFWLVAFLILLQSFTGIVIFIMLSPIAIVWWAKKHGNKKILKLSIVLCSVVIALIMVYAVLSFHRFNRRMDSDVTYLESYTLNGNPYKHDVNNSEYENGYRIWIYLCEEELASEWNTRSNFKFDSLDRKDQQLSTTLIRYMTSLGLTKDSLGITKLTEEDISMVEKGYTSHLHKNKFALYPRIYELLWEMHKYRETGDPSGQSLGQRIEYLKTGWRIAKRHIWFGTGTGDVVSEFRQQYEIDQSLLQPRWRHRTHNQLITFLLSFGIFGFLWICFAFITPPIIERGYSSFLFVIFFFI